jgi:deazaflavin-dependent oxidoreductase (nitroreductase family)
MKRILVIAVLAPIVVLWGGVLLPRRWFYKDRRPTKLGRMVNGATGWVLGALPFPGWVTLETRGRKSGRVYAVPLVVARYGGDRYLVSMLGERSGWVPNIRAANGHAVIRHGARRREVALELVPVEQRAPIIKAYLRAAPGGRPHFKQTMHDPVEAFESISAEHPVFRIVEAPVVATSSRANVAAT